MISGIERIAKERQRQMQEEGWTPEHDDEHDNGELAAAAECYLREVTGMPLTHHGLPIWPWDDEWWKPSGNPIRNLEKAGALIAAEIDRRLRANARQ